MKNLIKNLFGFSTSTNNNEKKGETMENMFCFQCEQAANGGCSKVGVCGKQPDVAALQDLLVYTMKGIAFWADKARGKGVKNAEIDHFMIDGLFTTVTNVDFSAEEVAKLVRKGATLLEKAQTLFEQANGGAYAGAVPEAAKGFTATSTAELVALGAAHGVKSDAIDADVKSVQEIIVYGMKGYAAYAHHALVIGRENDEIYAFTHKALAATLDLTLGLMDFVGLAMECGRINLVTMELLDKANTDSFGHPVPTPVQLGTKAGKAILVSGHDLRMLEELLKQTEGKGINIYTHGEMLPAHGYPGLKKYAHLAGNFGGAWQDQAKEFVNFPGAIIFNTNCIQRPAESYKDRLFTWGLVQWPDVKNINGMDFAPVIEKALALPGFEENLGQEILTGFGHNAVLGVADKVIAAVKAGDIRHFFLIGGCDGAKSGRNYYTEFAENVPKDCVILTLACGKYRFNKLDFGDIGGIPRLLDIGQCNDAYSAIQIAVALAGAFNCGVNELPLSFILSWYEQKAVAILLTLLHLGVKNIKLGPSLPAFITPNVLNFLVENFNIGPIGTAEGDLKQILG
ncbi:iron-sulfur-oxygen hybrid cluster protein (prismane) [Citrifermentans bemidjiense Bem]|uniref:Hydroxylamine reductase n=2 Tax=Citrifermentans bemidjiense TaxID=225194 RepID=B5EGI9_CITBB|nr:iron-sulfur-oxygen hybrid cluster protein (prismane) [Citrifermentans bemidjiense Bem]